MSAKSYVACGKSPGLAAHRAHKDFEVASKGDFTFEVKALRIVVFILCAVCLLGSIRYTVTANFSAGLLALYCITLALALWGIFFTPITAFCSHGIGCWLKWLVVAGVGCFLLACVALALAPGKMLATGSEDAMIVLGGGLKGGTVSETLRRRLDAAYDFYLLHPDMVIVVTGGQGPDETRTEAEAMKEYLVEKGIPAQQVLLEDKSTSTLENFSFAREVLKSAGYDNVNSVALVTNRFHCYRARLVAQQTGFAATAIPATISITAAVPCYIREVMAIVYYWLFIL